MISRAGSDPLREGNLAEPGIAETDNGPAASRQHYQSSFEDSLNQETDRVSDSAGAYHAESTEPAGPGIFDSSPSSLAIAQPDRGAVSTEPATDDGSSIQALIDAASTTGPEAELAFEKLLSAQNPGSESIEAVVHSQIAMGTDGINMLGFIAGFPGKPEQLAVEGLKQLARNNDQVGADASSELLALADDDVVTAKDAVRSLLLGANETTLDAAVLHADSFSQGMIGVLNAMADLGDPGLDTLVLLAESGFDFARDGLGPVAGAIENAVSLSTY